MTSLNAPGPRAGALVEDIGYERALSETQRSKGE